MKETRTITETVYMLINKEEGIIHPRKKIIIEKKNKGHLMDGRPVRKIKNKWCYIPV